MNTKSITAFLNSIVLQQIEHLKSYPIITERIAAGHLQLHGWWFELNKADVFAYDENQKQFVLFDEKMANELIATLNVAPLKTWLNR